MTVPSVSKTESMQIIASDRAWQRRNGNPRTMKVGHHIDYPDDGDGTDDRAWGDALAVLRRRGLTLRDTGSGYVVTRAD